MTAKVRCWCQHCQKELPPSHTGPCPHCGKTGKNCKVEMRATVGIKATLSAVHEAHWSSNSWAILAILLELLFGLVCLIYYGVYELLPLPTWLKIVLTVIVFFVLLIVGCWQRYRILMLTRWLDRKAVARKTTKSK